MNSDSRIGFRLWETIGIPEVTAALTAGDAIEQIGASLVVLLKRHLIKVYEGAWQDDDPADVTLERALHLLADRRQYSSDAERRFNLHRVYFMNVDNIRDAVDSG